MPRKSKYRSGSWHRRWGDASPSRDPEEPYNAPEIFEPNYSLYEFRSKLQPTAPPSDPDDTIVRWQSTANEEEIRAVLSSPMIVSPFTDLQSEYEAPKPQMPIFDEPPQDPLERLNTASGLEEPPPEPQRPDVQAASYALLGIPITKLNAAATRWRKNVAEHQYLEERREWTKRASEIEKRNSEARNTRMKTVMAGFEYKQYTKAAEHWREQRAILDNAFEKAMLRWWSQRQKYEELRADEEQTLQSLEHDFLLNVRDAIEAAVVIALRNSRIPWKAGITPSAHYDTESKILLVNFDLPDVERISFFADRLNTKVAAKSKCAELKDKMFYGIALAVLHDLAVLVQRRPVEGIVLNCEVSFIDKATGHERTEIVASVFGSVQELLSLNIVNLDPKTAFSALKGISVGPTAGYAPVPPIMSFSPHDGRVVEGRQVIDGLQQDENIASMRWEDFEHLIRELFEKEFSAKGMEVKVTRASRDSGVDAIAFDPDPVSGGKLVIQAKRYTRTVDVSAVRDLFGTVQSEGANKGILVTTSKYGPDSHAFARGKPLTLLDGNNLLALLQKHGYRFSIDLEVARKELKEKGWL